MSRCMMILEWQHGLLNIRQACFAACTSELLVYCFQARMQTESIYCHVPCLPCI